MAALADTVTGSAEGVASGAMPDEPNPVLHIEWHDGSRMRGDPDTGESPGTRLIERVPLNGLRPYLHALFLAMRNTRIAAEGRGETHERRARESYVRVHLGNPQAPVTDDDAARRAGEPPARLLLSARHTDRGGAEFGTLIDEGPDLIDQASPRTMCGGPKDMAQEATDRILRTLGRPAPRPGEPNQDAHSMAGMAREPAPGEIRPRA